MSKNKRFETILCEGFSPACYILRDKKTGVQYLYIYDVNGIGGLTPLLDENGRPIIDKTSY